MNSYTKIGAVLASLLIINFPKASLNTPNNNGNVVDPRSVSTASNIKTRPHAEIFENDISENIKLSTPLSPKIPVGLNNKFNITYQGAFRVAAKGDSNSGYAVGTLGINESKNSLFMAGHDHHGAIAEFAIPKELSFDYNVNNIVKAKVLQEYVSILDKKTIGNKTNKITGILFYKNNLLVNSEIWYDGSSKNQDNLQVFDNASDLKNANVKGMLQLSGAAYAAGYMSAIPTEWQEKLSGKFITGWASNYSITNRYSQGPSMYVFDPEDAIKIDIDKSPIVPTTPKMFFPLSPGKSLVEGASGIQDKVSPIWSTLSGARYGFIVPNTNYFMVVGYHGGIHSGIGYKIKQDNGNLCGGSCTKKVEDIYNYFWLFDINDILTSKQPYSIAPISYGKWSHPYDNNGQHRVLGAVFNSHSNRLFISLKSAGRVGKYDRPPLIVTYEITAKEAL